MLKTHILLVDFIDFIFLIIIQNKNHQQQNKTNTMENLLKINSVHHNYLEQDTYSKEIINQGFVFIDSDSFQKIQKNNFFLDISEKDVSNFIDSWNYLDLDMFMSDNGKYRTRKHATFSINDKHKTLLKNSYIPHFQTIEYNNLNGGIVRYFSEIDKDTIENPVFRNLLQCAYSIFSEIKIENWLVEAHQFRIKAQKNDTAKPTAEGIHRDGVDFVLMTMIKRHNVRGGIRKIYDLNKNLTTEFMLKNFLDMALIADHQVYHSVTEIQVNDFSLGNTGLRDVLVITFKKA